MSDHRHLDALDASAAALIALAAMIGGDRPDEDLLLGHRARQGLSGLLFQIAADLDELAARADGREQS